MGHVLGKRLTATSNCSSKLLLKFLLRLTQWSWLGHSSSETFQDTKSYLVFCFKVYFSITHSRRFLSSSTQLTFLFLLFLVAILNQLNLIILTMTASWLQFKSDELWVMLSQRQRNRLLNWNNFEQFCFQSLCSFFSFIPLPRLCSLSPCTVLL